MSTEPRTWITALRTSQDHLATVADGLDAGGLRRPSYCDEWTVADVLSHLGSQAEIFQAFLDTTLAGEEPPGQDAFPPIWDRWNAKEPEVQAADSIAANERFVEAVEALSDERLAELRPQIFGMDLDAVGLLRMRLGEHAVHSWDVAVAFDDTATLESSAVELLVDSVAPVAARSGAPQGKAFGLETRLTGPERHLALVVGDAVTVDPWEDRDVDGVLTLPAEAFIRLAYGRLDPDVTLESATVGIDDVRALFPGF
jgi:uncharacterized protein (TIGR03083 family)